LHPTEKADIRGGIGTRYFDILTIGTWVRFTRMGGVVYEKKSNGGKATWERM